MEDVKTQIIKSLPYSHPFLFVDELIRIDENSVEGVYTFRSDEFFYAGHFEDRPVTPGVILTECMAQIGVVCLGLFLSGEQLNDKGEKPSFVFSESHVLFEKPVYPGQKVHVISRKKYWRLGKLHCMVEMYNSNDERVCVGELSGMIHKLT